MGRGGEADFCTQYEPPAFGEWEEGEGGKGSEGWGEGERPTSVRNTSLPRSVSGRRGREGRGGRDGERGRGRLLYAIRASRVR